MRTKLTPHSVPCTRHTLLSVRVAGCVGVCNIVVKDVDRVDTITACCQIRALGKDFPIGIVADQVYPPRRNLPLGIGSNEELVAYIERRNGASWVVTRSPRISAVGER